MRTDMNTIDVSYESSSYKTFAPKGQVLDYLNLVLDKIGLKNVEFSVSFVTEDSIHAMNRDYRQIDDSTDILSFASEDEDPDGFVFVSAGRRKRVLGDMVICPEVLKRNAKTFGVSEHEELRRLLIHGVLHLSGDNHQTNDMTEPMLIRQEKILSELALCNKTLLD